MTADGFPAWKAKRVRRLLCSKLGYVIVRTRGSHRRMESPDHPPIIFAFHDGSEVPPKRLRSILVQDVGLSVAEALELLS